MTWSPYCDLEEARSLLRDLLAHSPAAGLSRARALHRAGGVEGQLGAHKEAVTLFESSVDLLRRLDAPNDLAYALFFLGQAHNMLGRFDAATEALGGAASLAEEIGNRTLAMGISAAVGEMAVQRGDYAAGRDILTECVAYFRSAGDAYYMTGWLPTLAHAQMRLNDDAAASASLHESLRLSRDFNDRRNAVWCLMGFSRLAAAKGDHRRSIRLRAAAEHLARELAMSLDEWWLGELPPTTNHRSPAWNQGTAMTMDHAVAYALGDSTTLVTKPLLSIRERSVAGMVAQGQSNRLIAERLHISERTAESHLEHIRNKLGFHSRSQVATWATEEGLVSTAS
jgi:DNA-binding CsgD family transcriptional regulator